MADYPLPDRQHGAAGPAVATASSHLPPQAQAVNSIPALLAAPYQPYATSPTSSTPGASIAAVSPIASAPSHHDLEALQAATADPGYNGMHRLPPIPGYSPATSPNGNPTVPIPARPGRSTAPPSKQTRMRRACDMCSSRKVKCDEAGPPCKACISLGVECTYTRPQRRRGPPNRHAEAAKAKRARTNSNNMSPTPHNAAETLVSISADDTPTPTPTRTPRTKPLDAEDIAPWDILVLLVDDFFTYIHPLTPFPHEPTFRQAFLERRDRTSPRFLALLASMIGTLVASFPRSARYHLKAQHSADLFPRAILMIEQCRLVAMQARGVTFMAKEDYDVYDAATSYFLGLGAGYSLQWRVCHRYMAETMAITRELGLHRPRTQEAGLYYASANRPLNHIEYEIGKRIFWVQFVGTRSMTQLGSTSMHPIIPPPTGAEPYPELPADVNDEHIFADGIQTPEPGTITRMTGFIKGCQVYMTMNPILGHELHHGFRTLPWSQAKYILHDCLAKVNQVTAAIPAELRLDLQPIPGISTSPRSDDGGPAAAAGVIGPSALRHLQEAHGQQYYPAGEPTMRENDLRNMFYKDPRRRLQVQFEIQKSNIYASSLATRSYFVELYLNLRDANRARQQLQPVDVAAAAVRELDALSSSGASAGRAGAEDPIDAKMTLERELIVENTLVLLTSIPQRSMEPNGNSLINKIRQVASTLLNGARERKGPVAVRADQYLGRFLEILVKLEKLGGVAPTPLAESSSQQQQQSNMNYDGALETMTPEDEDQELRHWADLREFQVKFAQSGGFLGIL
ncbi:uncharacterized protein E0L32_000785 [Thyridium curvatum]|uniref:Zn(2)-C6 fungal-type domain-containing protein n=1 Tax=Thyridium curvatum TaxID=1093900 RepID=A0A507B768_9PEZI|nr:uncharacterized protein E0L32_000785 [Thyridium curvatum]TPX12608.1 hypothetical protein E0L32_000785 [Thyridium curvatum]